MSSYKMIKDYKGDVTYRASFNALAKETFGIDFEPWYQNGFWNERYICYTMVDGDRVISNVSISKLSICMDGETYEVLQIGTVMTHPDYRKQGLAGRLMEAIYEDYDNVCDFYYLFGNDFAYDFYVKYGFTPVQEHSFAMTYKHVSQDVGTVRKLVLDKPEDKALIMRLAKNKTYISKDFGIKNEQSLLLFYMLYVYTNEVYYIEDKDAIVIYEIDEGVLNLVDVLCEKAIPVDELLPYIANEDIKKVSFEFTPNIETSQMTIEELHSDDSTTMFRKLTHVPKKPFRFSECSHA